MKPARARRPRDPGVERKDASLTRSRLRLCLSPIVGAPEKPSSAADQLTIVLSPSGFREELVLQPSGQHQKEPVHNLLIQAFELWFASGEVLVFRGFALGNAFKRFLLVMRRSSNQ